MTHCSVGEPSQDNSIILKLESLWPRCARASACAADRALRRSALAEDAVAEFGEETAAAGIDAPEVPSAWFDAPDGLASLPRELEYGVSRLRVGAEGGHRFRLLLVS